MFCLNLGIFQIYIFSIIKNLETYYGNFAIVSETPYMSVLCEHLSDTCAECVRACVRAYIRTLTLVVMGGDNNAMRTIPRTAESRIRTQEQRHRTFSSFGALLFHSVFILFRSYMSMLALRQSECVAVWTTAAAEWFSWRSGYYSRFDAIVMSASGTSAFPSSIFSSSIHEQTSAPFDRSLCRFALIRGIIFTSSFRSRFYEHTRWNRNNWLLLKELHSPRNEFEF